MTSPVQAQPVEATPDFSRLNRAASYMRALAAVTPQDPNFNEAQTLFQAARQEYIKEAQLHHDFYARQAQNQVAESPDLGPVASGRIGVAQGLGGAGGALAGAAGGAAIGSLIPGPGTAIGGIVGGLAGGLGGGALMKPLAQLFSTAPSADVKRQWDATTGAHPDAQLIGQVSGGIFGGFLAGFARKLMTGAALKGEQLAQAQIRTKQMALRLQQTEAKLEASAAAGKPVTEEAFRRDITQRFGQQFGKEPTDKMVESAVAEAKARGLIQAPNPSTGQVTTPQGAKVVQTVKDQLDQPTFLRRGMPQPPNRVTTTPEGAQVIPPSSNPFTPTAAEQTAQAGAKGASAQATEAARTAYNLAKAAGKSDAEAKEIAARVAGFARGGSSSF